MNPFATSRRSFCGTPNSLTWSPTRTSSRVQGLSLVTSTRTASPWRVCTTNSRGVIAVTLPWTSQRSSPAAGERGITGADDDGGDLVRLGTLDSDDGDAAGDRARVHPLGAADVGVVEPAVVTANHDERLGGKGRRPLESAAHRARVTGGGHGGPGEQKDGGGGDGEFHGAPPSRRVAKTRPAAFSSGDGARSASGASPPGGGRPRPPVRGRWAGSSGARAATRAGAPGPPARPGRRGRTGNPGRSPGPSSSRSERCGCAAARARRAPPRRRRAPRCRPRRPRWVLGPGRDRAVPEQEPIHLPESRGRRKPLCQPA